MKLDFIGEKYIEEYKEKSSQEFKKMVGNIEQEVKTSMGCTFLLGKKQKK